MADSTNKVDIAEQICLAVDQIVTERIKGINYDTTIIATVVENKDAKNNKYICSNGSAQFEAFSSDTTFRLNESVLVTVPNNDYDNQKFIVGRYVIEGSTPYSYIQPFNTIIDASSNLIKGFGSGYVSLLANEDYDNPDLYNEETKEYAISQTEFPMWSEVFDNIHVGYERLGIQGQFKSYLKPLKPTPENGNYGYYLEILSYNGDIIVEEDRVDILKHWATVYSMIINKEDYENMYYEALIRTPDSWFDDIKNVLEIAELTGSAKTAFTDYFDKIFDLDQSESKDRYSTNCKNLIYAMLYSHGQLTVLELDSSDMYGDPNNFQSYHEVEKVYDITSVNNILAMYLFFYQKSATFLSEYTKDGYMAYRDSSKNKMVDNLFSKEPYICLGYDLAAFDSEEVRLYSTDTKTYVIEDDMDPAKNKKAIRLRWLHEFGDKSIKVVIEDNDIGDYEVRWYRYRLGAPSADAYSGEYWDIINPATGEKPKEDEKINLKDFNCVLIPSNDIDQEQIKAIILFEKKVLRSNIISFQNQKKPVNETTVEVLAGLSLHCLDNSFGNYFLYGQNNNLFNESKQNEVLTMEARFASSDYLTKINDENSLIEDIPPLAEAKEIVWEFPLRNTMIVVNGFDYSFKYTDEEYNNGEINQKLVYENDLLDKGKRYKQSGYFDDAVIYTLGNTIYITRQGNQSNAWSINNKQDYRIARTYSATNLNNTVKCTAIKDSKKYSATKELNFGIMGTNGTDATLVLDFDNNKTALNARIDEIGETPFEDTLGVTARLYDYEHNEVDFNNLDLGLTCEWTWAYYKEYTNAQEEQFYQDYLLKYYPGTPEELLTDAQKKAARENCLPTRKINLKTKSNASTEIFAENKCEIVAEGPLDIDANGYFLILQATVKGFGDYDLIAYKAIPIRRDARYRNIIGATELIYDSYGKVDYYSKPYEMWWANVPLSSIDAENDIVAGEINLSQKVCNWNEYNPYEESPEFVGTISLLDGTKQGNILKPVPLYVRDSNPYGVECKVGEERIWIQPLVILQNKYPSSTLNKWNGKDIELNETEGYILAPAISAGKKNDDNTFSGVILGDWSFDNAESTITAQTGLYGFYHGDQSFGFKEDGTAFIGRSGIGRISFDGNEGTIRSGLWDLQESGMFLDLTKGYIKIQKNSQYIVASITEEDYEPKVYYIITTVAKPIEINTGYEPDTVYYIKTLKRLLSLTESNFEKKKSEGTLYVGQIVQCTFEDKFDPKARYYEYVYTPVEKVTKEEFDANKSKYYVKNEETLRFDQATEEFKEDETYYTRFLTAVTITEDLFVNNEDKYFYVFPQLVTSTDVYSSNNIYYEPDYELHDWPYDPTKDRPYEGWNTPNDELLSDPYGLGDSAKCYYSITEEYALCQEPTFDPDKTYYIDNGNNSPPRYITISSIAPLYPLAIGAQADESQRPFRVTWDGTAYLQKSYINGDITANYLTCNAGNIGGWTIFPGYLAGGGVILSAAEGLISGAVIEGSVLRSGIGGISLDGYFNVIDSSKNLVVDGTYIGFMQSDTDNDAFDLQTQGVGFRTDQNNVSFMTNETDPETGEEVPAQVSYDHINAQVKATTYNAGFSYTATNGGQTAGGGYISISAGGVGIGASGGKTIRLNSKMLVVSATAENQKGIYARFA